jgi:hypothetical protein
MMPRIADCDLKGHAPIVTLVIFVRVGRDILHPAEDYLHGGLVERSGGVMAGRWSSPYVQAIKRALEAIVGFFEAGSPIDQKTNDTPSSTIPVRAPQSRCRAL